MSRVVTKSSVKYHREYSAGCRVAQSSRSTHPEVIAVAPFIGLQQLLLRTLSRQGEGHAVDLRTGGNAASCEEPMGEDGEMFSVKRWSVSCVERSRGNVAACR